jgi:hypothetical protein
MQIASRPREKGTRSTLDEAREAIRKEEIYCGRDTVEEKRVPTTDTMMDGATDTN